jgi:hypothetical protein
MVTEDSPVAPEDMPAQLPETELHYVTSFDHAPNGEEVANSLFLKYLHDAPAKAKFQDKPTLSPHALSLWAEVDKLDEELEQYVLYANEEAGISPLTTSYTVEALRQKVRDAADLARGVQTEEFLSECLGQEQDFEYAGTLRGVSYIAGPPYVLTKLWNTHVGEPHLVRGYVGGAAHKHWYLVTECTEETGTCEAEAYVRLKREKDWYGKNRLEALPARVEAFNQDMATAKAIPALCLYHRSSDISNTPAT